MLVLCFVNCCYIRLINQYLSQFLVDRPRVAEALALSGVLLASGDGTSLA
jgi:hypothetical protein